MEENTPCFECGQQAVYNHHVIPVAKGGKRTVTTWKVSRNKHIPADLVVEWSLLIENLLR